MKKIADSNLNMVNTYYVTNYPALINYTVSYDSYVPNNHDVKK